MFSVSANYIISRHFRTSEGFRIRDGNQHVVLFFASRKH